MFIMNKKQKFPTSFLAVALVFPLVSIVPQEKVNFTMSNKSSISAEKAELNRINKEVR